MLTQAADYIRNLQVNLALTYSALLGSSLAIPSA